MKKFTTILTAGLLALSLAGCSSSQQHKEAPDASYKTHKVANPSDPSSHQLADLTYQTNQNPIYEVNDNHSTLNINDWKTNHVEYQNLDRLNRTSSTTTAYLEPRNVANDSLRTQQTWKPTGWHQKFNAQHQAILNRGHIIAYSLSKGIDTDGKYDPSKQSGDQNNPRNLFTQTAFCNQKLQTIYEQKVRDALKAGAKVIYQVTPIFKGNNLMASGVHLQAIGTNGLDFNVYLYNVQPHYQFNYQTGTSKVCDTMNVPTPNNAPTFHDEDEPHN